jgi:hypothetical protein
MLLRKHLTKSSAGNAVEQMELSYIACGMQNGTTTLGSSLANVDTLKHMTCRTQKFLLRYFPKRNENLDHMKTYAIMLTEVLLIIAKNWKRLVFYI